MKTRKILWIGAVAATLIGAQTSAAQGIDEERMRRDIEVAENVLSTLIKHEMGQQRTFFGMDVKGSYQPGYGVTFRLPGEQSMPFVISLSGDDLQEGAAVISDGNGVHYTFRTNPDPPDPKLPHDEGYKLKDKVKEKRKMSADSVASAYNAALINAAKNFIVDYGDFISQLGPNEKIIVTNQGDRRYPFSHGKRTRISVEGIRADVTAVKQGKMSREQALKKLTVVNTESVETREADMEMLSSIFSRLYRPDLSKTYFVQGNVYYERLKDYGAIYYMQMVSSNQKSLNRFEMPTVGLDDLDQEARDKKVTELYPAFEADLKENILEYGRTLKSLKDDEILVFNISITKCSGCGIPSTLEVTIKGGVLREYGSGKISKGDALSRFMLKKGASQ